MSGDGRDAVGFVGGIRMGYAQYVGRVGALAVALGVGAAVATTPGIAWADDGSPASPPSAGADADPRDAAEAGDPSTEGSGGTSPDPAGTGASEPTGTEVAQGSTTDATTITVGSAPPVTITSSGGAHSAVDSEKSETVADDVPETDDETLQPETSGTAPERPETPDVTTPPSGSDHSNTAATTEIRTDTAVGDSIDAVVDADNADLPEATATADPSDALTASSLSGDEDSGPATAATPIVTPVVVTPVRLRPPGPLEILTALPGAVVNAAATLVTIVLAPLFAPGIVNAPNLPPETPALWVTLAWARRQLFNSRPTLAPVATTTDPTTGLVTGSLGATDPDGDPLTYTVVREPTNGELVINAVEGSYIYTPHSGFAGSDTFVVEVSDGGPDGLFGFLRPDYGHTTASAITLNVPSLTADPAYTIEDVDTETGAVTGRLNVTGLDSGAVTLTVTSAPSRGAVVVNADGTFVYTPTPIARSQATWFEDDITDPFTVTVSDGFSSPTTITVSPIVDPSLNALAYQVPPDVGFDTYALDSYMQVDPVTGRVYRRQVRTDLENWGSDQSVRYYVRLVAVAPDGSVITTDEVEISSAPVTTIDPVTGAGHLTATFVDPETGVSTTHIAVITADGDTETISLAGSAQGSPVFNTTTGRGYQTVVGLDPDTGPVTHVVRFDRGGALLGTETLSGRAVGGVVTDPVAGRDFQTTEVVLLPSPVSTTHLTIFGVDGSVVTHAGLAGKPVGQVIVNGVTGSGYQTSVVRNRVTGTTHTEVVVVDAAGEIVDTETISGVPIGGVVVNPLTGSVYQTTIPLVGPDDPLVTVVTVINPDGTSISTEALAGSADKGVVVNPATGTVYQITTNGALDSLVSVIGADGSVRTEPLPGWAVGEVVFNPVGDSAYITTTSGGVSTLSVVDGDGRVTTVPGTVVGAPVFDPDTGSMFVTSTGVDGATVTVVDADGAIIDMIGLGGEARDGVGLNPANGTVYQTTYDDETNTSTVHVMDGAGAVVDSFELSGFAGYGAVVNPATGTLYQLTVPGDQIASTLHVIGADGTVVAHELPGLPYPLGAPPVAVRPVVNPVTGAAYLVITDYVRPELSPVPRAWIVVVSPDGTDANVIDDSDGFRGAVLQELQVNPVTGVAYQISHVAVAPNNDNGVVVTSIFEDGSIVVSEPMIGFATYNSVIDPGTGTVYQGTSTGVWVVDVSPETPPSAA